VPSTRLKKQTGIPQKEGCLLRCYELVQRGREDKDLKALSKTTAKAVVVTPLAHK